MEAYLQNNAYLTPREGDIVKLLAKGMTPRQIAVREKRSYFTIMTLISRAMKRLRSNSYDLVYKAHQMGFIKE